MKAQRFDVLKHFSAVPVSGTPVALVTRLTPVNEKLPHAHGETFALCTFLRSPANSGEQVQEVQSSSLKTKLLYCFIIVLGNLVNCTEI
jgi:hypothetical protein